MEYFFILLFAGLGAAFVLGGLGTSYLLAPHRPGAIKNTPYECGEQPIGRAWFQFNVGYYLFGLLFLVFDVVSGQPEALASFTQQLAGLGVEFGAFLQVASSTFGSLIFTNLPLYVAIMSGTSVRAMRSRRLIGHRSLPARR